jgi:hypothetical protein
MDNGDTTTHHGYGSGGNVTLRSGAMDDQLNVPLEDVELLAEVELTTNLIIAASEADQALSQAVIDEILGVDQAGETLPPVRLLDRFPTQTRHSA